MGIRKCPKCGLPIANMSVCPVCGTNADNWTNDNFRQDSPKDGETKSQEKKSEKTNYINFNKIRITPWEVAFILICNVVFVLTLVNILVGGVCWCHYPSLALFVGYFFAFACASKSLKRFLTRYRNAVFITNIIAGIFNIVYNSMMTGSTLNWALDYFVPINLICACTVMMIMLFIPSVSIKNVMISTIILLLQSTLQFVLFALHLTGNSGRASVILISVAFGINLITVVNYVFTYFIKCRNAVFEKFRLWE